MKTIFTITAAFLILLATAASGQAAAPKIFVVNSTADVADTNIGDGKCKTADKKCTLRAAIQEANSGITANIYLPAGTYYLTLAGIEDSAAKGDLDIKNSIVLFGEGMHKTIIDGGSLDRVFQIMQGNVQFFDLTIQHGDAGKGTYGGGIMNFGTLNLYHVAVRDNAATQGGGIYNANTLYMHASQVEHNTAVSGGGIGNSKTLELVRSAVIDNSASGNGGGISNEGGNVSLTNTTVGANSANNNGGGIHNQAANGTPGTLTLLNITITQNSADKDQTGGGDGGGVFNLADATVDLLDTIIAANFDKTPGPGLRVLDCKGTVESSGHNLIGSATGCSGVTNNVIGDKAGSLNAPLSPKLGTLQLNGGFTETYMPEPNSPARDAGDTASCSNQILLQLDQRGVERSGGADCDIGSVEAFTNSSPQPAQSFRPTPNKKVKANKPIKLSWVSGENTDTFRVEIHRDSPNGTKVFKATNLTATQVTAPAQAGGHTYYWIITACNASGCVKTGGQSFKVK